MDRGVNRTPASGDQPVPSRRNPVLRMARLMVGWILLVLGIIGLFLPLLQGVALILTGLALLAPDVPFARRWLDWLKNRLRRLRRDRKGNNAE